MTEEKKESKSRTAKELKEGESSKAVACDRDIIIIARSINYSLFDEIVKAVKRRRENNEKNECCTVILTTTGGNADASYRIAKFLQNNYTQIRLLVASYCKSAGTLMAIAANEVVFGEQGELGPLDVQVLKKDEFGDYSSGLDIIEAMEEIANHIRKSFAKQLVDIRIGTRISTRLAGELSAQITSAIASPLYAQIDPQRVAEMKRAMTIATMYGERLDKQDSLKGDALEQLTKHYPSHGCVIDEDEAKKLFNNVSKITADEQIIIDALWHMIKDVANEPSKGLFFESYGKLLKNCKKICQQRLLNS